MSSILFAIPILLSITLCAICARGGVMKIVAYIPIKLNNERLPNKNIKTFFDKTPLIHFVQRTLLQIPDISQIYVYCSDESIKPYLLEGVQFLQRSKSLDTQQTLCGDIIDSFINTIKSDIYVLAHATAPFVNAQTYIKCIESVKSGMFDSAFGARKYQNFVWYRDKPLNFSFNRALRTQDMSPVYHEVSSPYVFTQQTFETYRGRTGANPYICECSEIESIDIDYPRDFELANIVYKHIIKGKK